MFETKRAFIKEKETIKKNINKYKEGYDVFCLGGCLSEFLFIERDLYRKRMIARIARKCEHKNINRRFTLKKLLLKYDKFLETL